MAGGVRVPDRRPSVLRSARMGAGDQADAENGDEEENEGFFHDNFIAATKDSTVATSLLLWRNANPGEPWKRCCRISGTGSAS